MGIPQIAAIMGMCVAGGGYLPLMCDHVLMTEGSGLFLAGPALVQAAIGAKYSAEELGGAKMHSQISGTVDYREPDDESCIARIRSLVDKMGNRQLGVFDRKKPVEPLYPAEEIYGIFDADPARAVRHEGDHRAHRRWQPLRRVQVRIRRDRALRLRAHRRLRRRYRRQPEDARPPDRSQRQQAHRVRRRDLHRVGGEGRALHHGLQPEPGAAHLSARCQRLHGGTRRGVERHHSRRREDGECRVEFRGAEDRCDRRRLVRRGTLCDVRQGLRSALHVCVANGEVLGDGRRIGGRTRWWRSRSSNWSAAARS